MTPISSSRWESIPTQQNPRFPRNVHRSKRDAPKIIRRKSSGPSLASAAIVQIQNELKKSADEEEIPKRLSFLDGTMDAKFCFERRCSFIVVRRSTTRTSCSDITVDSELDSDDEDDDDDDGYISEEESLVDDDDDDDDNLEADSVVPTILVLALEAYEITTVVKSTQVVSKEVRKEFASVAGATKRVAVDTVDILIDPQSDEDSRNSHNILTMAAIKKHIQRTQPKAIVVVTEDSLDTKMAVEAYDFAADEADKILNDLKQHHVPTISQPIYGQEIYKQWVHCFDQVGLEESATTPVVFLHLPSLEGSFDEEALVKGSSIAISRLASGLVPE